MKCFVFIGFFFIIKVLGFFRRYFPSEIQKRWSKLQSTFPAVQSKEIIVWKQIYKRPPGWKFRTFGQLFCQFFEPSIHYYQRDGLRKITFLTKPLLCIEFFGLEGWNFFLAQNRTSCLSVSRRTIREKHSLGKKTKKLAIQRRFTGLSAEAFVWGCENCNLNVQGIVYSYFFFCKNLLFLEMFP